MTSVSLFFAELPEGLLLNLGAGATGVDTAAQSSVNVDLRRPARPGQGRLVLADGHRLPFADASFDGALLKDVVEHSADPLQMLTEVHRVLKPGGRILITTPRPLSRAVWDDYTHIRGFTRGALLTLLSDSGWEPLGAPRRMGGLPGAGRLELTPHLEAIMRIPVLGHRFGTNWIVRARRE